MSDYTKTTNFAAKDSLPSGNSGKIVKGSEIDTEFTNIQTAVATKLNSNNGALTGTTTASALTVSGNIDVDGTSNLDVVDIDGAVDMASTLAVGGVVTANAGIVVDNITIDGTEIDLSSGDLTIDVAGDINLDAGGDSIIFKSGGTHFGDITKSSNDLYINAVISDGDIYIRGNDGGSTINALQFDMSAAGAATFNDKIIATELDISGNIDVDGTTNLDVVDIDGAVDMASTLTLADDLIVDTDTLFVDVSADRVGINTASPAYELDVDSTIHIGNDGGSGFTHSRLIFDSNGASRGTGNFFHNQDNDVEWFAGNPYNKSDSFAITRNASSSHADATANVTNALVVVNSSGNLGVGDDDPASRLTVSRLGNNWSGVAPFAGCAAFIHPGGTGAGSGATLTIAGNASSTSSIHFSSDTDNDVGRINYLFASNAMSFFNNGTERIRLDSSGNLLVGGTSSPSGSEENIVLFNGTAPTGSATDGIILYAEDVSSSSELKVRDEAGNVTTLSPHNFELIPEGPSEDMAWSYFSERDGKRINVDMLKAIRVLEKLSGEQLVFES